jgi:mRNA interferase HigB
LKIIGIELVRDFGQKHPQSRKPLQHWETVVLAARWKTLIDIKKDFNSVDYIKGFVVFDIHGNNTKLIAVAIFQSGTIAIQHVFTHAEYDKWSNRLRKGRQPK